MRAILPIRRTSVPRTPVETDSAHPQVELLSPLIDAAENSNYLVTGIIGEFTVDGAKYQLPRFIFLGDKGGGDIIRLAVFAGLREDDRESVDAVVRFLLDLEHRPWLGKNYHIYVYPVTNPVALAAEPRNQRSGLDLTKQFWQGSTRPEVYYLERELGVIQFHGVVSIRGQSFSQKLHAQITSAALASSLATPAEQAANRVLEARYDAVPVASRSAESFLTATSELKTTPFEIILEYPNQQSRHVQISSIQAALNSILTSYREIAAFGINL